MQPASIPTRIDSLSSAELSGSNWSWLRNHNFSNCWLLPNKQLSKVETTAARHPKSSGTAEGSSDARIQSWNFGLILKLPFESISCKAGRDMWFLYVTAMSSGEGCNKQSRTSKKIFWEITQLVLKLVCGKYLETPSRQDPQNIQWTNLGKGTSCPKVGANEATTLSTMISKASSKPLRTKTSH